MSKKNKKNKFSFSAGETIKNIIMLVPNIVNILSHVMALINLETRIAGKTIITVLMLAVVCAILLTTTWLGLLAMLCVYLISLQWSLIASLAVVLVCNAIFLIGVGCILTKIKKRLFFPATLTECRNL